MCIFHTSFITLSRRNCVNHPDNLCYICGFYTIPQQRRNLTSKVQAAYELYFGCKVGDQDKAWAPDVCCLACSSLLLQWIAGKNRKMPFAIPMVWRVPSNHDTDCYFCMTSTVSRTYQKRSIKDSVSRHSFGLRTSSSWCWNSYFLFHPLLQVLK